MHTLKTSYTSKHKIERTVNMISIFITIFLPSANIYVMFRSTQPDEDTTKAVERVLNSYNLTLSNFQSGC